MAKVAKKAPTHELDKEGDVMTEDAKQALIDGLNEDLAHEFQAVIHYLVGAQLMTGQARPELKEFFTAEIQDELNHAEFLAHKVTALGGTPTTQPVPVELGGSNREQLEIAMTAEAETIERYKRRVDQANAVGDAGLAVRLEDLIADETEHLEELQMVLRDFG